MRASPKTCITSPTRLVTIAIIISMMTPMPVQSAKPPKGSIEMKVDPAVVELSKAKRLESQLRGEGGVSPVFQVYDGLSKRISKLQIQELMWLTSHGTAAARVYASFLTFLKDKNAGAHSFLELLDDDSPLEYQSGCEVSKESVSSVGRSVVATGSYIDFPTKVRTADGKPIYVSELEKAEKFADEVGGEGGRYRETLVFGAAMENVKSLKLEDLQQIKAKGTPAGRLYAAVLMHASGKASKDAYDSLSKDQSRVTYASGCKMTNAKVAEVAKQLKETGHFLNFKVKL